MKAFRYILILALTFIGSLGITQVTIHTDKPYYVAGETVWYKAYFSNPVEDGSTIRANIVNASEKKIHSSFIKVDGSSANGYFRIPYDIKTENYYLVLDGKSSIAENIRIAEILLPIYNDLNLSKKESNLVPIARGEAAKVENLKVDIRLPQNVEAGELVNAKIMITNSNGEPVSADVSVSIVDQKSIGMEEGMGLHYQDLDSKISDLTDELFIDGKIYDASGNAIKANVIGAYSRQENAFSFTKSDVDGNFVLPKTAFTGQKELQFVGYQLENESILAKLNSSTRLSNPISDIRYTEAIESYMESSRMRKKINQHFKIKDKTRTLDKKANTLELPKSEVTYNVQEYQDFGNMAEFAKNLMMPLRFSGSKGERTAQVINPKSSKKANYYLNGNPLFIIDGKLTRNAEFVASLEQSEVKDLQISFDGKKLREQYNVMGSSGVVIMNTFGKRTTLPSADESNIFKVNGIQERLLYPVSYATSSDVLRMPVFDTQLYWNPEIKTSESGSTNISFVQSNDRSTFRIIVVAQTADGKIGLGYLDYVSSLSGE